MNSGIHSIARAFVLIGACSLAAAQDGGAGKEKQGDPPRAKRPRVVVKPAKKTAAKKPVAKTVKATAPKAAAKATAPTAAAKAPAKAKTVKAPKAVEVTTAEVAAA